LHSVLLFGVVVLSALQSARRRAPASARRSDRRGIATVNASRDGRYARRVPSLAHASAAQTFHVQTVHVQKGHASQWKQAASSEILRVISDARLNSDRRIYGPRLQW